MKDALQVAAALLTKARSLCVLTGAGASAESGISTFRDAGGLWEKHSLEDVATPEGFAANPRLVWTFYNARRKAAKGARPNPAHTALAQLETRFERPPAHDQGPMKGIRRPSPFTLLTQNIDGLHQLAGSGRVVELHGSVWKVRCTECEAVTTDFPVELPLLPYCGTCQGLLRPHIVWFGEPLDTAILDEAETAVEECDAFLVVGTSAVVEPAASFPRWALQRGVPLIEVNKETTPLTARATVSLQGKAGDILPALVEAVSTRTV